MQQNLVSNAVNETNAFINETIQAVFGSDQNSTSDDKTTPVQSGLKTFGQTTVEFQRESDQNNVRRKKAVKRPSSVVFPDESAQKKSKTASPVILFATDSSVVFKRTTFFGQKSRSIVDSDHCGDNIGLIVLAGSDIYNKHVQDALNMCGMNITISLRDYLTGSYEMKPGCNIPWKSLHAAACVTAADGYSDYNPVNVALSMMKRDTNPVEMVADCGNRTITIRF